MQRWLANFWASGRLVGRHKVSLCTTTCTQLTSVCHRATSSSAEWRSAVAQRAKASAVAGGTICAQDWHQPDTAQATNRGDQHAKQPSQARTRDGQTGHHQVVGGVVAVAVLGRVQHLGALGVIQASPPPHIQNKQSCQQTQQHDAAYHNSCRKAKSQAAAAVQQQGHAARKGCQLWWCTLQCL